MSRSHDHDTWVRQSRGCWVPTSAGAGEPVSLLAPTLRRRRLFLPCCGVKKLNRTFSGGVVHGDAAFPFKHVPCKNMSPFRGFLSAHPPPALHNRFGSRSFLSPLAAGVDLWSGAGGVPCPGGTGLGQVFVFWVYARRARPSNRLAAPSSAAW